MGETQTRKKSKGKNKSVMHPFLFFLWAHGPGRKFAKRVASWWSRIFPRNPTPQNASSALQSRLGSACPEAKFGAVPQRTNPLPPIQDDKSWNLSVYRLSSSSQSSVKKILAYFFFNLTSVCCWGYWILSMRVYMICNQIHSFPPSAW